MRGQVGGGDVLVVEHLGKLRHHVLGLESRHRRGRSRVRQVVGRGERAAIGQTGCGGSDRRVAADTAGGDADDAPGLTTELAGDHSDLGIGPGSGKAVCSP